MGRLSWDLSLTSSHVDSLDSLRGSRRQTEPVTRLSSRGGLEQRRPMPCARLPGPVPRHHTGRPSCPHRAGGVPGSTRPALKTRREAAGAVHTASGPRGAWQLCPDRLPAGLRACPGRCGPVAPACRAGAQKARCSKPRSLQELAVPRSELEPRLSAHVQDTADAHRQPQRCPPG